MHGSWLTLLKRERVSTELKPSDLVRSVNKSSWSNSPSPKKVDFEAKTQNYKDNATQEDENTKVSDIERTIPWTGDTESFDQYG